MPFDLSTRLVVGVASSALFNLTESDAFFRANGEAAYRAYQDEHLDNTLEPGVAFPFIKRLLQLNDLRTEDPPVEVIVLSKNDPGTGLRVMRSIKSHELPITRSVFTQGQAPYKYMNAFHMSLFLSGNRGDIDDAIDEGFPAGHVLPSTAQYDDEDKRVVVAFDFDGVLASDESERVFQESESINDYFENEQRLINTPLDPGLLKPLLEDLNIVQKLEEDRALTDNAYQARLRIALVTARSAQAQERAIRSMGHWGVNVNDSFFLGGVDKSSVLEVMRPHIFFDDQTTHLDGATKFVAGVHIPAGVANEAARSAPGESDDRSAD